MDSDSFFTLTQKEQTLFTLLLEVVEYYSLKTTLRVAGGWVRDKILGGECDDIDIALDDMLGKDFADYVNQYLTLKGLETHKIGVIVSNPEQSKHLETATMQVLGTWLDFVNLRSETYTEHSRIPTMDFGDPAQDAFRRDLTINSMFYNINKKTVEDFTEKGLDDLKLGLIRTPLDPCQTFLDDPLRILRAIRFAARYNFSIVPELSNAARNPSIIDSLKNKVSRERIGKEFAGMINGPRPELACHYILSFCLYDVVFSLPRSVIIKESHFREDSIDYIRQIQRLIRSDILTIKNPHETLLASLLIPLSSYTYLKKKRILPIASYIILDGLKFPNKQSEAICLLLESMPEFNKIFRQMYADDGFLPSTKETGLLLRKTGELYKESILLSLIDFMPKFETPQTNVRDPAFSDEDSPEIIKVVRKLQVFIEDEGLIGCWKLKPFFNGTELTKILDIKPGPVFGKIINQQVEWQLEHPQASKDLCKSWILQTFGKGKK